MYNNKSSIKYQVKSFRWAFHGLSEFFKTEVKAKLHLLSAIAVIISGFIFHLSTMEWALISLVIGIVFITEIINTALERLANCLSDEHDKTRGLVKDLGAAAVLVSGISALIIAATIFIPKV